MQQTAAMQSNASEGRHLGIRSLPDGLESENPIRTGLSRSSRFGAAETADRSRHTAGKKQAMFSWDGLIIDEKTNAGNGGKSVILGKKRRIALYLSRALINTEVNNVLTSFNR